VQLSAEVTIGNYSTSLQYAQTGLPIGTDSSLNLLLPILAAPIVQKVVSGSVLGIDHVLISDIREDSFRTWRSSLAALTIVDAYCRNSAERIHHPSRAMYASSYPPRYCSAHVSGAVDAAISFPSGLTVSWSGKPIGRIAMDDLNITGDVGGQFDVTPTFEIVDAGQLAQFSKVRTPWIIY
jgi:hypothetical protein